MMSRYDDIPALRRTCGSQPDWKSGVPFSFQMICTDCGTQGPERQFVDPNFAVMAWNEMIQGRTPQEPAPAPERRNTGKALGWLLVAACIAYMAAVWWYA